MVSSDDIGWPLTTPGVLGLGIHTQLGPAVLGQFATRHPLGPLEPVLLHHGQAAQLGALTHGPASNNNNNN